jgi:methylthioribulose-1-phosphate dehydratase
VTGRRGDVVSEQILTQLAQEAGRLAALGFMACTAGNVSACLEREPLQVSMSPSGVDKGQLKPSDFIRVGADARPLAPDTRKPSDEALLHLRIYQATACSAVCHGHPPHAVALSLGADPLIALHGIEMQKAFAGTSTHLCERNLPVVNNSQDMEELSRWVTTARNPLVPAVLVRGHGVYAWGATVREAGRHLETVEYLCRILLLARASGIALPPLASAAQR